MIQYFNIAASHSANKILYAFPANTGYDILEISNWQQKCSRL